MSYQDLGKKISEANALDANALPEVTQMVQNGAKSLVMNGILEKDSQLVKVENTELFDLNVRNETLYGNWQGDEIAIHLIDTYSNVKPTLHETWETLFGQVKAASEQAHKLALATTGVVTGLQSQLKERQNSYENVRRAASEIADFSHLNNTTAAQLHSGVTDIQTRLQRLEDEFATSATEMKKTVSQQKKYATQMTDATKVTEAADNSVKSLGVISERMGNIVKRYRMESQLADGRYGLFFGRRSGPGAVHGEHISAATLLKYMQMTQAALTPRLPTRTSFSPGDTGYIPHFITALGDVTIPGGWKKNEMIAAAKKRVPYTGSRPQHIPLSQQQPFSLGKVLACQRAYRQKQEEEGEHMRESVMLMQ